MTRAGGGAAGEAGVLALYQWLFTGVLGSVAGLAPWLARRVTRIGEGFHEYFGGLPRPPAGPLVWVHGVSLGESLVAGAVMRELRRRHPGWRLGFTTTHPDVLATARKRDWADVAGYFPLDFAPAMARAFQRWRPRLVLVSETDFWPVFAGLCRRSGVPLVLVNGRISHKLERFYAALPALGRQVFGSFTHLLVQTPVDGERLVRMGGRPETVAVTGNLKVDLTPSAPAPEAGKMLSDWKGDRFLVLFGSLHPSEFADFEPVFATLARRPRTRLLIAPRNLANIGPWERRLGELGLSVERRSRLKPAAEARSDADVLLLDTMGELAGMYKFADAAFVGGSLDPLVGGHNPLEPLLQGVPTVMGPHVRNFADLCGELNAAGGLASAGNAADVQGFVENIFADHGEVPRRREAVERILARHRGALDRTMAVVDGLL